MDVVVVDDGSRDAATVREVAQAAGVRLVRVDGLGPAAARNAGVEAARAPVVCFTDDDCEADPAWAGALAQALREGASVAAGMTLSSGSRWSRAAELIVGYASERSAQPFAASNNLAAPTALLRELPFDESICAAGGEDRDWCRRASERALTIRRVPDAVIVHHHPVSLHEFWRQQARYGAGAFRIRRMRLESPSFYAGLVRSGFREGALIGLAVCLAQTATLAGFARAALGSR